MDYGRIEDRNSQYNRDNPNKYRIIHYYHTMHI